jgi:predicted nucleotidyltransferase
MLSPRQKAIVARIVDRLRDVPGVAAIALGGSHARGRARPDSDIDIGLYYAEAAPLNVAALQLLAAELNDTPDPVVSEIGGWGEWVDGGAWLTFEGQRIDLLYRAFERIEQVLAEALAGRFAINFEQQPPFGFFGPTVLGEAAIAQALYDPSGLLVDLKTRVMPMPDALAGAIIQNRLWSVDFGLRAFVPKYVASGNVLAVAGCLTRFAQALVHTYLLNDKTALAEVREFQIAPLNFAARLESSLAHVGASPRELAESVAQVAVLFEEIRHIVADRYRPTWQI